MDIGKTSTSVALPVRAMLSVSAHDEMSLDSIQPSSFHVKQ